jgi:hypothetical protein
MHIEGWEQWNIIIITIVIIVHPVDLNTVNVGYVQWKRLLYLLFEYNHRHILKLTMCQKLKFFLLFI